MTVESDNPRGDRDAIKLRGVCSYNARLFNNDVTAIGVSYWQRREFPNYARLNRGRIFYNARFVATRFGNSLADVGFVMYQNELTHVIIGFKHNAPCIVRSEALRGHSHTSVPKVLRQCTRRVAHRALTDPRGPYVPPISQCTVYRA